MADYDLTKTLITNLDRHLAFPLLAYLEQSELFNPTDIHRAQYELAKGTHMSDYLTELYGKLNPGEPVPTEFAERRQRALSAKDKLDQEAQPVLDVIENPDIVQALRQDKMQNLQYLTDHYKLTLPQIRALYDLGQFHYSIGNYTSAAEYLYHFRVLSTDHDLIISTHWGKLASDILVGQWDGALEELNILRENIDSRSPSSTTELFQLQSRTWLLHWALYVYFNHIEGRTLLLETFLAPSYVNAIQTSCPWMLRYVAASAVLSRKASSGGTTMTSSRVRHATKEIVKIIQLEEYQYQDPITQFLSALYVDFDFEGAQHALGVAQQVVAKDFFLSDFVDDFLDNARYLISEAYCRIHERIDISDLSERLNLSKDEGEKWIVNLIRETRMGADAKIDLEKNVIEIHRPALPIYQNVIEKTRGLAFRTQAMGAALGRAQQTPPPAEQPIIVEGAR